MYCAILDQGMRETATLPFHERVQQLEWLRASADETIMHGLILWPLPRS